MNPKFQLHMLPFQLRTFNLATYPEKNTPLVGNNSTRGVLFKTWTSGIWRDLFIVFLDRSRNLIETSHDPTSAIEKSQEPCFGRD